MAAMLAMLGRGVSGGGTGTGRGSCAPVSEGRPLAGADKGPKGERGEGGGIGIGDRRAVS
eukprot:scaffold18263_cov29-Tisochrysis_lutea.AAC.7